MKRKILSIVAVAFCMASPASGSIVRGTISDSATGAPISNVKVVLMQNAGEIELMLDSSRTGPDGSYSFTFPSQVGYGLYIYTISATYYFQSKSIEAGLDDTITQNIKLRKISTMVLATPHAKALQNIAVRTANSRLYLSGIKTGTMVDIYDLNGRLLLRTAVPAGASEVRIPERGAAAGCYRVSISTNGHPTGGMALLR